MPFAPAVIVLAAGLGGRSAGPRAGAADAASQLSQTLHNAFASRLPVVVVTTAALAPVAYQQAAARDVVVMSTTLRGQGVGDAIAAGVAARIDAPGWLVLPGDMPRVQPATLRLVGQALATHPVAYAQYRGQRGHPIGFAAELCSELVALAGDDGARRLVARYPAQAVEADDPGVLVELESVHDLATLRAVQGGRAVPGNLPLLR